MSKVLSLLIAASFVAFATPVFAQGKGPDCNNICLKRCSTAGSRDYCMNQCVQKCNMRTGGK